MSCLCPQEHDEEERASLRIFGKAFQWLRCTHVLLCPRSPPMASYRFPHKGLPKPPVCLLL